MCIRDSFIPVYESYQLSPHSSFVWSDSGPVSYTHLDVYKRQWTPRATKLAQEAGLDPAKMSDIEATGPGGRVSGDDVTRYIEKRRA